MISPCHSPKMGASIAVSLNVCLNRWNTQEVEEEATFEALIQNSLIESKHLSNASASDKRLQVMHHFVRQKRPYPQYPPHLYSRQYSRVARPRWSPVFPRSCNPRLDRLHFAYIGSATQRKGGLSARKYKHDKPSKQEQKSFNSHLGRGDIKRTSKFGVLFSIPTSGLKNNEFITIRQIIMVAEAVSAYTLTISRIRAFTKQYMEIPARSFPGGGPAVISAYSKVSVVWKASLSRANT